MIHSILEGTHTLNALITQVLDYAKPMCLHFTSVNFVDVVRAACDSAQANHTRTQFRFQSALKEYVLTLDKERITLVLLNILRNASEAEASVVKVLLNETGSLSIHDNGLGISPQSLHKIFTPFFTTKAKGTGLGLAASLAVVKAHGGTLEVTSQEGKGTQFTLIL